MSTYEQPPRSATYHIRFVSGRTSDIVASACELAPGCVVFMDAEDKVFATVGLGGLEIITEDRGAK